MLPEGWLQILSFAPILIGTIILVCAIIPYFWATLPFYFVTVFLLIRKCETAERKLKELEASNRAPMFSHLSNTLEGLFSIRVFQTEPRFISFNQSLIDADHKYLFSLMSGKSFHLTQSDHCKPFILTSLHVPSSSLLALSASFFKHPLSLLALLFQMLYSYFSSLSGWQELLVKSIAQCHLSHQLFSLLITPPLKPLQL